MNLMRECKLRCARRSLKKYSNWEGINFIALTLLFITGKNERSVDGMVRFILVMLDAEKLNHNTMSKEDTQGKIRGHNTTY